MTHHIVHVIHSLTLGGAARTMIATAKYSRQLGPFRHSLVMLDLKHSDPKAAEFALAEGMEFLVARTREEVLDVIKDADIVQINWWQHPEMDAFLRSELPPARLLGWIHVAGDSAPQVLTDELVDRLDLVVGGSSYTYFAPSIWRLPTEERLQKSDFVIGGADFQRLSNFKKREHRGFNVGYNGTVNPTKMYNRFVPLHQGLKIPGLKVIVCGGDFHLILREEAEKLGIGEFFDFRGYTHDISDVLAELDVYGYPLCADTYAASELNLQEAMYAGIPSIVFPHGGIKTLIINEFNGLVVRTEREYREALTYLFHHPEERERLGRNAAFFAREMFGAERNAPKMNRLYEKLLQTPKKQRSWPKKEPLSGALKFVESLGEYAGAFSESLWGTKLEELLAAEAKIIQSSPLMVKAGIMPYLGAFPENPHLQLWSGLGLLGIDEGFQGAEHLLQAERLGLFPFPFRVYWYLSLIADEYGDYELKASALERLKELAPDFTHPKALFASSLASRPSKRPL